MTTTISTLNIGCTYLGIRVNILAYADDMVLLAPSWKGLQAILNTLDQCAKDIDMLFNTKKTVCMVFQPSKRQNIICNTFPPFSLAGSILTFVEHFKYLGHIIDNHLNDDIDINREIKNLFLRTNLLHNRFKRCSLPVKINLFRTFCICFYDTALWSNYSNTAISKFRSCYHKCLKFFFNYMKYSSVTQMLLEIGLPSFNTLIHNYSIKFCACLRECNNHTLKCISSLVLLCIVCHSVCLSACFNFSIIWTKSLK